MMEKDKSWPAWFYGPNGESQVFDSETDVPAGWHDHPSKVAQPETAAEEPAKPPLDL